MIVSRRGFIGLAMTAASSIAMAGLTGCSKKITGIPSHIIEAVNEAEPGTQLDVEVDGLCIGAYFNDDGSVGATLYDGEENDVDLVVVSFADDDPSFCQKICPGATMKVVGKARFDEVDDRYVVEEAKLVDTTGRFLNEPVKGDVANAVEACKKLDEETLVPVQITAHLSEWIGGSESGTDDTAVLYLRDSVRYENGKPSVLVVADMTSIPASARSQIKSGDLITIEGYMSRESLYESMVDDGYGETLNPYFVKAVER